MLNPYAKNLEDSQKKAKSIYDRIYKKKIELDRVNETIMYVEAILTNNQLITDIEACLREERLDDACNLFQSLELSIREDKIKELRKELYTRLLPKLTLELREEKDTEQSMIKMNQIGMIDEFLKVYKEVLLEKMNCFMGKLSSLTFIQQADIFFKFVTEMEIDFEFIPSKSLDDFQKQVFLVAEAYSLTLVDQFAETVTGTTELSELNQRIIDTLRMKHMVDVFIKESAHECKKLSIRSEMLDQLYFKCEKDYLNRASVEAIKGEDVIDDSFFVFRKVCERCLNSGSKFLKEIIDSVQNVLDSSIFQHLGPAVVKFDAENLANFIKNVEAFDTVCSYCQLLESKGFPLNCSKFRVEERLRNYYKSKFQSRFISFVEIDKLDSIKDLINQLDIFSPNIVIRLKNFMLEDLSLPRFQRKNSQTIRNLLSQ